MNVDFEAKFRKIISDMAKIGEEYAEAKSQSYRMQELRTSILSSIVNQLGEIPVSKAESRAKASNDYKTHIEETARAIHKELSLRAKYETAKASFEGLRSLCSLEKKTQSDIGQ